MNIELTNVAQKYCEISYDIVKNYISEIVERYFSQVNTRKINLSSLQMDLYSANFALMTVKTANKSLLFTKEEIYEEFEKEYLNALNFIEISQDEKDKAIYFYELLRNDYESEKNAVDIIFSVILEFWIHLHAEEDCHLNLNETLKDNIILNNYESFIENNFNSIVINV